MRRSQGLILVGGLVVASAILLMVPLLSCPSCSGAGKITVMGSHPEAMGSPMSSTGKLVDVPCPSCGGAARLSLYHRWSSDPQSLSSR